MGLFWKTIDPIQLVGHIITFIETEDATGNVLFQASNGKDFLITPNGGELNLIDGDMADLIDSPITHASMVKSSFGFPVEADFGCGLVDEDIPWAKYRFETANGAAEFFIFKSNNVQFKTR